MAFITSLHESGKKHSTILAYVSAIGFAHKVRGLTDPTSTFLFAKLLAGIKKGSYPDANDKLQPITFHMLKELVHRVDDLRVSAYIQTLIRAIMSLMYHACLRISEVGHSGKADHALRSSQVSFSHKPPSLYPHKITLTLTTFKHSKAPQTIQVRQIKDSRVCPVRLLWEYSKTKRAGITFFCDENGVPVTRSFVMSVLRQLVGMSSFSDKRVNTHSFRIGRTTDLVVRGGVSDAYIRHVGRWSSNAYLKYIRSIVVL